MKHIYKHIKSRTVIIIIPAQSAQKHTARFEAIATELRAESAGNVRAMDLEAAVHQTHGDAPEHSETIIDASGLATEHSEEGRPPRILITEVVHKCHTPLTQGVQDEPQATGLCAQPVRWTTMCVSHHLTCMCILPAFLVRQVRL